VSELRELQAVFAQYVSLLIQKADLLGYEVTLGEAWRSPEERERVGFPNSNHGRRLAIDLNLFRDGAYLPRTKDHEPLGEWWEKQHPLARWGGRFADGNHYSFEYRGVK